ncbi:hypothetical protein LPTSP4_17970 [Leptospira ryugenii]|uniref:Yip1 domain-containing protein n=1 Tax=Leptospira ryugenii TaxID=1917863 RepID=A0A2P2E074_9LEPT|nr:hypothetical protein [Leptospira ryugenii]GBF50272.1 hypothetical protein LPTSP4_17970 [Leptospira ryugenii]
MQNLDLNPIRKQVLKDIFFSPKSAFDLYFNQSLLGQRDLFLLYVALAVVGALTKFLGNTLQMIAGIAISGDEETPFTLWQSVLSVFIFYFVLFFLFRIIDSFRMYHEFRDKTEDWDGPPPHVFQISFLPMMASSVFWILPNPFPLFFLSVGFLYSLQLAYLYLSIQNSWTSKDFFFFLLKAMLFFLFLLSIPMFLYHIIRTVLN